MRYVIAVAAVVGLLAPVARATLILDQNQYTNAGVNILVNPGFETGALAPWFVSNGAPFVTNAEAHTGVFSVAALGGDEIRQNFSAVPTEDISEVSVWIKRFGGPFDQFTFYYDDGSTSVDLINGIGQGDDWLFFDITSFLVAGKNLDGFSIFGTSAGPAFLDDFVIATQLPAPGCLALLGLAGLMGKRRRRR